MFHHVKELQYDARVSGPDVGFARLLLEQFGGGNGELKAAMQYFVQAFGHKRPHPDVFDMLMDIATEEFSHLEIVGATITMLLEGINGELKDAVHKTSLGPVMDGKASREELIHQALTNPAFLVRSGGGPTVTDCNGVPWSGSFVNANGDLTVDLRSNIAAESRAKLTYEYLMQFTDDPLVKDSLSFLMTREITHFQMFSAALETIQPNFPPGILQGDPRYTHTVFNLSQGQDARGPWNEGEGPWAERGPTGPWVYYQDPISHVHETRGLQTEKPAGGSAAMNEAQKKSEKLGELRSSEVKSKSEKGERHWSDYQGAGATASGVGGSRPS